MAHVPRILLIAAIFTCSARLPLDAQRHAQRPAVERLGFLVGTFEGEARVTAPGAPTRTGRMSYRGEWDLDGAIVKANYEQRFASGPVVSGHLVFRWRPQDSTYAFEGYANALMDPHRLKGGWGGDGRLVFEGAMAGTAFREFWQARGPDTLVTGMEFQQGDRWIPVSENILVRKP